MKRAKEREGIRSAIEMKIEGKRARVEMSGHSEGRFRVLADEGRLGHRTGSSGRDPARSAASQRGEKHGVTLTAGPAVSYSSSSSGSHGCGPGRAR